MIVNTISLPNTRLGHKHSDEFALINMNTRLYDPKLGRLLSVDNFVSVSLTFKKPAGKLLQNEIRSRFFLLLLGCNKPPINCKVEMQNLLQEEGFALKDSFKITFCNSGWGIGESYAAFSAVISSSDYALMERALNYKFRFATFPTKEKASNYILFNNRLTRNEIMTAQFQRAYYVKILRQNSYTSIILEDDSTLYITYEN